MAEAGSGTDVPARFAADVSFGFLIHDTSRVIKAVYDRLFSPLGTTRSQWALIAQLSRGDGVSQTQLAEDLELGRVALGSLVDRLEAAGIVLRRQPPDDRRVNHVFLTDEGRRLVEQIRAASIPMNERMFSGIPDDELATADRVLRQIKENLLQEYRDPA